ncbi:hypothetical protein [uncultured Tenacibaculum sp.]|uniref:hypothetical protein n=1 Tax=uncultured Tenacibaculum sp. TaxID=174713 RepID=UPI002617D17E|nr:hypothetical protein [uncultured Tenacibaculum sp.]
MNKIIFLNALLFLVFTSCSSDDTLERIDNTSLNDLRYDMISYNFDTPFDLNGDGIFSTDVFKEGNPCGFYPLFISEEGKVVHPHTYIFSLNVETDTNGEKKQTQDCGIAEALPLIYEIQGNSFVLKNALNDQIVYKGTISNDKKTITLTFPDAGFFKNNILKPDGTYEEYTGSTVAVYNLVE